MKETPTALFVPGLLLITGLCCSCFAQDKGRGEVIDKTETGLSSYRPEGKPSRIPGVTENASGLTYSPKTGTLFVILDSPAQIVEFTTDLKLIRRIRLGGFADPEGIVHVEGDTFAIVEENRGTICIITVNEKTALVKKDRAKEITVDQAGGNRGLEGITYDPESKHFYVVKERGPKKIYKVSLSGGVSNPWDAQKDLLRLRDLSAVYFDRLTGHLILLSHESSAAVECSTEGKEISRLRLRMGKAEGITMDAERTLCICGEPNALQFFR